MEKKLHLYNSKSDYLNEKDSFTPIYNVSYVIDTDEVLYNYVSRQGDTPIVFADSEVKRLCVENWGSNGEITYNQAAAVTDLGTVFKGNTAITSFDELQYFTGLQKINDFAFQSSSLTSVTIPNSVTTIGMCAFWGCSITSVTIPNGVTTIGFNAFYNCSITSVTIPNSITTIDYGAFTNCPSLTSVTIPDSVTTIGNSAFNGCKNLTFAIISNSLTTIGVGVFANCTSLTSVTIPDSVTTISDGAFNGCSSLPSVTIPNGVTTIGGNAFYRCYRLTSITSLAMSAPIIQNTTFNNLPTGGTLYVPANATGYNVWMGTGDYYLGKYNWTLFETFDFKKQT